MIILTDATIWNFTALLVMHCSLTSYLFRHGKFKDATFGVYMINDLIEISQHRSIAYKVFNI